MAQVTKSVKPIYVATDVDERSQKPDSAKFIKNLRIGFNRNGRAVGSEANSGSNMGARTPLLSNIACSNLPLPYGFNKSLGSYESQETNELYYFNYNGSGNHGIYMIDGSTMQAHTLIVDPKLGFSLLPQFAIPAHRVHLKVIYSTNAAGERIVKEKYLMFTNGHRWQYWINVLAAVKTEGFTKPDHYWKLHPPHFDRRELFEYATRPPHFAPVVKELPLKTEDKRKRNNMMRRSTQFAYQYIYTDGRTTTLSQYSNPYEGTKMSGSAPRCLELTLYAGSPMVEKIRILRRHCDGDWKLYDTINKYPSCAENDPAIIGEEYWKRTKAWDGFSYNAADNTIKYTYCSDKECTPFSQEDANRFFTDLPLRSIAMTAAGDAILFGDNEYGYDNLSCEVLSKFKLSTGFTSGGSAGGSCMPKTVKITVYSVAVRDAEMCQFSWKNGEADKEIKFGGCYVNIFGTSIKADEANLFELNYADNPGPRMYLAGTPYYAYGKQYKVTPGHKLEEIGVIDSTINDQLAAVRATFYEGGFYVNKYEFNVPAGRYIARMSRHNTKAEDDYQKTSTYVMGIADSKRGLGQQGYLMQSTLVTRNKEIEIDATNGDVDLWGTGKDMFYVFVPYDYQEDWNHRWRFIEGYVMEDKEDKLPVELLHVEPDAGRSEYRRHTDHTDHNGFYWVYSARGEAKEMRAQFSGTFNCNMKNNFFKSNDVPYKERGYYKDDIYMADINGGKFGACNRVILRGTVQDADGNGIENVAVTVSRGSTAYTLADGTFELIVHNSYEARRLDRIYYNASATGFLTNDDCTPIEVDVYDSSLTQCTVCTERVYPVMIKRKFRSSAGAFTGRGLKGGGRYGIAVIGHDLAGRATYANLIGYVDIPTIIETEKFAFPVITVSVTGSLKLPSDIAYLSFARTRNLNNESYLQWVGDKIEYLDRSGEVVGTPSVATRARIKIQSLLDYNTENNFSTTTTYQFVRGDYIRIYDDGNGKYFKPDDKGYLDLQILGTNWNEAQEAMGQAQNNTGGEGDEDQATMDGAHLIVAHDRRLEDLKDSCGFWIELNRPNECKDKEQYCEIAGMYPVIRGEIKETAITLDTWDTFFQQRIIPNKECAGKAILHPFESNSITDFWGENCGSCGRLTIRDEGAKRRWYPDDVIKSDELVNEGRYNGLGTFREKNRKQFKGQSWGGIIAMHAERNIIGYVCQNDWFTTDYEMNVARVREDGVVLATLPNALGDPNQKVGSNWGCEYEHTSSILFEDGKIFYCDAKNANVVALDYRQASDLASIDNKSYFTEKFKFVMDYNRSACMGDYEKNAIDIIAGYDPLHRELHITFRPRRNNSVSPSAFANNEREIKMDHQETFTFSLDDGKWVRFAGFCPEAYGTFRNAKTGVEMVSFSVGVPFTHNSRNVTSFNNFFSVPTERVLDVVFNDEERIIYQNVIVDDPHLPWFIDKIETSEHNCFSYLPLSYFKKKMNVWYAELLRDMNSYNVQDGYLYRTMLIDGKTLFGDWARMRFVGDPRKTDAYSELKGLDVQVTGSTPFKQETK